MDFHRISVTNDIVLYTERMNVISLDRKRFFRLCQFYTIDLKRKFRCNCPQCRHDTCESFGPDDRKRFCSLRISHRQKKPRKTADMIRVKMCHAENIDRFKAKSRLFDCNLGSLTAIDQQTAPIISEHK